MLLAPIFAALIAVFFGKPHWFIALTLGIASIAVSDGSTLIILRAELKGIIHPPRRLFKAQRRKDQECAAISIRSGDRICLASDHEKKIRAAREEDKNRFEQHQAKEERRRKYHEDRAAAYGMEGTSPSLYPPPPKLPDPKKKFFPVVAISRSANGTAIKIGTTHEVMRDVLPETRFFCIQRKEEVAKQGNSDEAAAALVDLVHYLDDTPTSETGALDTLRTYHTEADLGRALRSAFLCRLIVRDGGLSRWVKEFGAIIYPPLRRDLASQHTLSAVQRFMDRRWALATYIIQRTAKLFQRINFSSASLMYSNRNEATSTRRPIQKH
jgi:hypothetical protein